MNWNRLFAKQAEGQGATAGSPSLMRTYAVTLLTVALLTLAGQILFVKLVDEEKIDAARVKSAHLQRNQVHRIARLAQRLQETPRDEKLRDEMSSMLQQWSKARRALIAGDKALGLPALTETEGKNKLHELENHYDMVFRAGLQLAGDERAPSRVTKRFVDAVLKHEWPFANGMQAFATFHEARAKDRIDGKRNLMLALGILTLFILLGEFFFGFQPKVRALREASERLAKAHVELLEKNERLDAQRRLLEEQRAEMASQNDVLRKQQTELEMLNVSLDESQGLYAQAARRLEQLFNGVPVACFCYDADGTIYEWNQACEKLYDRPAYMALDNSIRELLEGSVGEEDIDAIVRAPFEERNVEGLEWRRTMPDGSTQWILSSTFPLRNDRHEVIVGVCANVDITERKRQEALIQESAKRINEYSLELEMQKSELEEMNLQLEALATTDGLTGLRNHRSFQERLESDVVKSRALGSELSLILLDVDNFKRFNDTYGHQEGDEVLRAVASTLREYERDGVTVARYGGEEFVMVLPGFGAERGLEFAEQVRQRLESEEPTGRRVTASFGLATWKPHLRSRAELIAQADKALYKSKELGRNRVTVASSLWEDEDEQAA